MLLSMAVTLYTSRIVLEALGVEDYGLYNVIGGIISIFSVLKVLVSSGTQRFLTFELGKGGNTEVMTSIFTSSLTIFLIIGLIIISIAETVGVWFLNTYMVIPNDKLLAANIVYQISIISMMVSLVQIPYTSAILSHERMDVYGYIGIAEPILTLALVSSLPFFGTNRLIVYSIMMFFVNCVSTYIYINFCRRFEECKFRLSTDIKMGKTLLSFTVWNLLESLSNQLGSQGQNILINMFFGATINAARAVAYQVDKAVQLFASNFLVAIFPQITKNYSAGNYQDYYRIMMKGSKFAFIVISVLYIPIAINTQFLLKLWLKTPPEYSSLFVNLVIIAMLIRMISEPLYTGIQATGRIKKYQIYTNVITLLNLPVCYFLFKIYKNPVVAFYVTIGVSILIVMSRLYFISKQTGFPVLKFVTMIVSKCLIPFSISIVPVALLSTYVKISLISFFSICFVSIIWSIIIFGFISTNRNEREFIKKMIFRK